ncbi:hypothetical protein B0H17DRAFT_1137716 [Mycena rosella]|uniref:Uncharacterized protein n=1 Tax=Mycena rosella TaxID=1033263 RepID=A0AAD7GAN5_MYCRO|nr:hypothetical protein B0H17DRAFT_1137716 [Mycena rosella]
MPKHLGTKDTKGSSDYEGGVGQGSDAGEGDGRSTFGRQQDDFGGTSREEAGLELSDRNLAPDEQTAAESDEDLGRGGEEAKTLWTPKSVKFTLFFHADIVATSLQNAGKMLPPPPSNPTSTTQLF